MSAEEEFRARAEEIVTRWPDQFTRWTSLVIWGNREGLTREQMVAVLEDLTNFRDESEVQE